MRLVRESWRPSWLCPDNTDTLNSRNNLAAAYRSADRVDEAVALYKQTLVDMERGAGP